MTRFKAVNINLHSQSADRPDTVFEGVGARNSILTGEQAVHVGSFAAIRYIARRLQNPQDLWYFMKIALGTYAPVPHQIVFVARQTALGLGACVYAPAMATVNEAQSVSASRNPLFYWHRIVEHPPVMDAECLCTQWDGSDNTGDMDLTQ